MPNPNFGTVVFHSKDKDRLVWLREKLLQAKGFATCNKRGVKNKVAHLYGLVKFFDMGEYDVDYRNYITEVDDIVETKGKEGDYNFSVATECAWNFDYGFFDWFAKNLRISYAVLEESDGEYGIAHDPEGVYFPENFAFESWGDEESKEFVKENELIEYLEKIFSEEMYPRTSSLNGWDDMLRDKDAGAIRVYTREKN
ncbi:MAG: hypothetical protein K6E64_05100 [Lachnospiraceae bacterium]|nr:hypothetical protein [Lachnospiraceae bacterium]